MWSGQAACPPSLVRGEGCFTAQLQIISLVEKPKQAKTADAVEPETKSMRKLPEKKKKEPLVCYCHCSLFFVDRNGTAIAAI